MKKYILWIFALIFQMLHAPVSYAQYDHTNTTYIQGNICSKAQNGAPIPGLLVSLAHQSLGRSVPAYTDNQGNFLMDNVPKNNIPYYLEVYWGQRLIYRSTVTILGPVRLARICI